MKAAIIGGGVIGGGWAARFLLNGWDVDVFDLDPDSKRKIGEVVENARRALPLLYDYAMPDEGTLRFASSLETAVEDANWVQESVPERLSLKHKVLGEITKAAPVDALIGSSTSGFKPSELSEKGARVFVAHPFNPVYLLPLIELVGAPKEAGEILESIGLYPLFIQKEIEAHIADRLLEAVWREALWLVKDGIATTEDIDESIRMGFGLRWAQMGLFETYRIAGGEAGMRHFMAQFGPALEWPWTKLTDVPEFNDALVELIAGQSDVQSGHLSFRELECQRDTNLIGFLRHLKSQNWGAGAVVAEHEAQMMPPKIGKDGDKIITARGCVLPSWIDYNSHMTEFRYGQILADGGEAFLEIAGFDIDHHAPMGGYYTVESHVSYKAELKLGERFHIEARVLHFDEKRLQIYQKVFRSDGVLAATGEHLYLFVNAKTGKTCSAPPEILKCLEGLAQISSHESWPEDAGKVEHR